MRPPTYNPNNTLGIKLPRLANTFFCLSIPSKNSRGQSPRLSVSSKAIPHNSKCRYGERGAAAARPKAQIILDAAKVSAASGGNSEPKQGQRSQSARGFCPRSTMRVPQPDIIEHFGNADAVPQLPERCLSRKAGIVRCCLRMKAQHAALFGIYLSGWSCWRWALTGWGHWPLYRYHAPSARGPDGILPT